MDTSLQFKALQLWWSSWLREKGFCILLGTFFTFRIRTVTLQETLLGIKGYTWSFLKFLSSQQSLIAVLKAQTLKI